MKDECINCGAWKGLHHYETNQCPRNGQEASLGKLQEWDNTVYQEDNTEETDRANLCIIAKNMQITELTRMLFALGKQDGQTIRTQAAEIERLKNEIIRFSDLSHNIVSYMAAYNSPEREKESNERIDMQLNAIFKAAGMA